MKSKKLTNFKIIERQDTKGNDYYIIFDNEISGNNAYFCWKSTVKEGWESLKKQDDLLEIEIEFEEKEKGNRVINVFANTANEFFV